MYMDAKRHSTSWACWERYLANRFALWDLRDPPAKLVEENAVAVRLLPDTGESGFGALGTNAPGLGSPLVPISAYSKYSATEDGGDAVFEVKVDEGPTVCLIFDEHASLLLLTWEAIS